MHKQLLIQLIIFLTSLSSLFAQEQDVKKVTIANNQFTFDLFKQVFKEDTNIIFSPYSISSTMAMTYGGAQGKTKKEFEQVFHFPDSLKTHQGYYFLNGNFENLNKQEGLKIKIANGIWKKENFGFKETFISITNNYYNGSVYSLTSAEKINDWTKKKTSGKITKLLDESDLVNVKMVLTNAVYFKGGWDNPFKKSETTQDSFIVNKNKKIAVDMMHKTDQFNYYNDQYMQIIELPYKNKNASMIIVLPKERTFSFSQVIENIDATFIKNLTYNSKEAFYFQQKYSFQPNLINLSLPKFSCNSSLELKTVLSNMGMPSAFDIDHANFKGITHEDLCISKVIHKAFIEVNEKGSEAAAATSVTMVTREIKKPIEVNINRPFLFFIKDSKTNTILFIGAIQNPVENE